MYEVLNIISLTFFVYYYSDKLEEYRKNNDFYTGVITAFMVGLVIATTLKKF